MVPALVTATLLAAWPPIVTVAPTMKFAPRIVTDVPPAVGPVLGSIRDSVTAVEGPTSATKASKPPPNVDWNTPGLVGKSVDRVWPATYAFPAESSAIERAESSAAPPKYVE